MLFFVARVGDADDAASDATAGIARRLASIIHLGMDDHASSDDSVLQARDGDVINGNLVVSGSGIVGFQVA